MASASSCPRARAKGDGAIIGASSPIEWTSSVIAARFDLASRKQTGAVQIDGVHLTMNWFKRTETPVESLLGPYASQKIVSYEEWRQRFLAPQIWTGPCYHSYIVMELEIEGYWISFEKTNASLEVMLGRPYVPAAVASRIRANGALRCDESVLVAKYKSQSSVTVGSLLNWINGPLPFRFKPFCTMSSNCQHFAGDLLDILVAPQNVHKNATDKDIVIGGVKLDGLALKFASAALRQDRQVVGAAVSQNSSALEFASDELKRDRAFMLEVARKPSSCPLTLHHAAAELKTDGDFINCFWMEYFQARDKSVVDGSRMAQYLYHLPKGSLIYAPDFPKVLGFKVEGSRVISESNTHLSESTGYMKDCPLLPTESNANVFESTGYMKNCPLLPNLETALGG